MSPKKWVTHTSNHSSDTFKISCHDAQLLLLTVFFGNLFMPHMVLQRHILSNMKYGSAAPDIKNLQAFFKKTTTSEVSSLQSMKAD